MPSDGYPIYRSIILPQVKGQFSSLVSPCPPVAGVQFALVLPAAVLDLRPFPLGDRLSPESPSTPPRLTTGCPLAGSWSFKLPPTVPKAMGWTRCWPKYKALLRWALRRSTEAIAAAERAVSLNRDLAVAYTEMGWNCPLVGQPEKTEASVQQ